VRDRAVPTGNRRRPPEAPRGQSTTLAEQFRRRLAATGASPKAQKAYVFQLRQLLSAAHRRGLKRGQGLIDLFADTALLGQALIDDRASRGDTLSRWTLAQRRSAVRSFARLMAPELRPVLGAEPERIVIRALRGAAERVGGGYRLSGGTPRRRGGRAPTAEEVQGIIAAAASAGGFLGRRNRAFLTLLYETGSRVNALREIQGTDLVELPDGRVRLFLHAKGRRERREVEVSANSARLLHQYVDTFNGRAAYAGRPERIGIGERGPFWRSTWWQSWAYANVAKVFERACLASGKHAYSLHALRRAFASDAASHLPRQVVAAAGGWQGLRRMDNHYVQTDMATIARKLCNRADCKSEPGADDRTALTV
jgi:integrase